MLSSVTYQNLRNTQNFIKSPELVRDLIKLSGINQEDLVIEIGAGKGVITQELVKTSGNLISIEQDDKFFPTLSSFSKLNNCSIEICDFNDYALPKKSFKVFSNIPFNITTRIISKLTSRECSATDLFFIMQADAAKRFAGAPYQRNTQNSVLLAIDFEVSILRSISKDFFHPKPGVEIVFCHFHRRFEPLLTGSDWQCFRDFVVYCYNHSTSIIHSSLKAVFTNKQLKIIGDELGLLDLRPADLSIQQWLLLFAPYKSFVSQEKKSKILGSEKRLKHTQTTLIKMFRSR
ncbi:MAG: hypothetical protein JNL74_08460 [Fibrobacteres bacterium]|nr:hypothetical protein [Fibrobacterota bacterium]